MLVYNCDRGLRLCAEKKENLRMKTNMDNLNIENKNDNSVTPSLEEDVVIKLDGVNRFFGKKHVLKDINLSFRNKRIYALVGNNGVGKTTMLKIISGLLSASSGKLTISKGVGIGALIENPGLFTDMSAYENLKAKSLFLGLKNQKETITSLLELVGLADAGKLRTGKFSMGMKQRLGIALALIGDPEVVILDEPTNSLDPQGIIDVRNVITKLCVEENKTIIVSSHNLEELKKVATDIVMLNKGEVVRDCTREEFEEECGDVPIDEYFVKLCN